MAPSTAAPAGIISHKVRGGSSFATNASSDGADSAPFSSMLLRDGGLRSKPTTRWPPRPSRSAMLAPMRPRPIMPMSMEFPSGCPCWLGALLGGLRVLAQVHRAVDHGDVRKRLREIAEVAPGDRIVFFSEQADVVGKADQPGEQRTRLFQAALHAQVVHQPEAAREKHTLARRQIVQRLVRPV